MKLKGIVSKRNTDSVLQSVVGEKHKRKDIGYHLLIGFFLFQNV